MEDENENKQFYKNTQEANSDLVLEDSAGIESDHEQEHDVDSISDLTEHSPSSTQIGQRLDVFVTTILQNATRSESQRLIDLRTEEQVGVRVNGRFEKSNYRLRQSDIVMVCRPVALPSHVEAEAIPLEIVYEDEDMLIINKPRGMVVHPAPGAERGTLVNAVLGYASDLSGIGGEMRPGIVHRLDKDTGGLIMVAKNDFAHRNLQAQIQSRNASRRYKALVWGVPGWERATVDAPIGRHPVDRKKMAVVTDVHQTARAAQTELTCLQTFSGTFALVEAKLQTGRTHQIRVHCAYINHPVVGDPLYGGLRKVPASLSTSGKRIDVEQAISELHGQALHAFALSVDQPHTGARLHFEVPLPPAMLRLIAHLENTATK